MAQPRQLVAVTFDSTQDNVAASWSNLGGTQRVFHGLTITDSLGPVVIHLTSRTTTGATVNTSSKFSGTVELEIVTT